MEWITYSHFKCKKKVITVLRNLYTFSFEEHEEELKSIVNEWETIL